MPESKSKDGSELVPVPFVAYEESADLDVDNSGADPTVENHDELVNSGQTYDEVRALKRSDAEQYGLTILTPEDALWDERFEDLESGDSWRVEELRE